MTSPASTILSSASSPPRERPTRKDQDSEPAGGFEATVESARVPSDSVQSDHMHRDDSSVSTARDGTQDRSAPSALSSDEEDATAKPESSDPRSTLTALLTLQDLGQGPAFGSRPGRPEDGAGSELERKPARDALADIEGLSLSIGQRQNASGPATGAADPSIDGVRPQLDPFAALAAAQDIAEQDKYLAVQVKQRETHFAPVGALTELAALTGVGPAEIKAGGTAERAGAFDVTSSAGRGEIEIEAATDALMLKEVAEGLRNLAARASGGSLAYRATGAAPDIGEAALSTGGDAIVRPRVAAAEGSRSAARPNRLEWEQLRAVENEKSKPGQVTPEVSDQLFHAIVDTPAQGDTHFNRGRTNAVEGAFGAAVVDQTQQDRGAPVRVLKLVLTPAELGPVTIVIKGNASALSVRIEPEASDAVAKVDAAREDLMRRLSSVGYQVADLAVAQAQQSTDTSASGSGSGQTGSSRDSTGTGENRREAFQSQAQDDGSRRQDRTSEEPARKAKGSAMAQSGSMGISTFRHV